MTDLAIPQGKLLRSRVVSGIRAVLVDALDRSLTGYAIVEPKHTVRFDHDAKGILTFEDGVPILAYHTGTDTGGKRALSDLGSDATGPCRLDLYLLSSRQATVIHNTSELCIPPEMPANHLAGDPQLAARTRKRAAMNRETKTEMNATDPDTATHPTTEQRDADAVELFLEDTEQIEAIREQARLEAKRRANEWGLADQLDSNCE